MSRIMFAAALAATASCAFATAANAAAIQDGIYSPLIVAGDPNGTPPDSPTLRIDPNTPTSPYSGVVSINTRYDGQSFICSGALIDATHIITAAHCIDTDDKGSTIDITKPGNDVRAVFNASSVVGSPGRAIITASKVTMHPDYKGFGFCPDGVDSFCVNDDVAIIELSQPAPADAKIYTVHPYAMSTGTVLTMVGYGTTGDGVNGYTAGSANFRIKRSGQNVYDLFDRDDEKNFSGNREVWYSDFDGLGLDTFCAFGACGLSLGNEIETALGGGDSGGPSFAMFGGEMRLVGNNTFSGRFTGQVPGTFGTYSGGMQLSAYYDWILANSNMDIPEPGAVGFAALGLLGLGLTRRRRKA